MPVTAQPQSFPLDAELSERLARLQPALPLAPGAAGDVFYIGWFNTRPISAAWATGPDDGRQLTGFAIHPATRGRGVLARLAQEMRALENAAGRRVLSADDYSALDTED
ncbi:acetyl-CoA sensor PanZ family protein [Amnimonas aquatica]|uniref:GNAT family N-acetyltransferase n=1 Tax=Amnimonas aquatica TaxID=2094561 RepID=A0A2P6ATZ4_9GAMM|nr:acetyl-CoA sensor PanZ family protein [Amnimonas aquatica]PQA48916.1 hypothetical protein C5O18_02890 [Amnimonas aquatica]